MKKEMKGKIRQMKIKTLTNHEFVPVVQINKVGPEPTDISNEALEEFLKNEIVVTKTCACKYCNYRRHMLRG